MHTFVEIHVSQAWEIHWFTQKPHGLRWWEKLAIIFGIVFGMPQQNRGGPKPHPLFFALW